MTNENPPHALPAHGGSFFRDELGVLRPAQSENGTAQQTEPKAETPKGKAQKKEA